jgi:DNA integrity scanning protein DisA with diadenylate cyclase activity
MLLAFALLPIAVGVAVLRYHLYDIDRLISRTIAWALVTGVLAAVFVSVVLVLQALLAGFTQGETLAVAASTLVAFALFQPLRRRVQVVVDRRFDRARYDGQRTVDAFAERLRDEVEFAEIHEDIHQTVHSTMRPEHVGIWLRPADDRAT